MFVFQKELAIFLLWAMIAGSFLGIVYDLFRIRRSIFLKCSISKKIKHLEFIWVFLEDLLFFMICGITVCITVFYLNSGKIRGIAVFSSLVGFVLYRFTVGNLFVRLVNSFAVFLYNILCKVYYVTLLPIFKVIFWIFELSVLMVLRKIYTACIIKKNLKSAEKGCKIIV